MSFEKFGLAAPILRAVAEEGYTQPTPIQGEAIPVVMEGRDVLGCAQTGTGKSAAFALPLLHRLSGGGNPPRGSGRKIRVLVLSPTRELALQIQQSFATYGRGTSLKTLVIYGGVSQLKQTKALQHGVDILVATPGRLLDLGQQGYVQLSNEQSFVLDEADRMLDMGFMPDIQRIINKLPKDRQTLLFSATMPAPIEKLAQEILRDPVQIRLTPERPTTDLIEQSVHHVSQSKKTSLLTKLMRQPDVARAIVFTRTKFAADRVARQLEKAGVSADAIHGNKSQNQRQRTLEDFRSDVTQVLVATDVAARGIDIDAITHVVNFDLPHEPETYVHRIGRTGRANSTGTAIAFCSSAERSQLKQIERLLKKAIPVADRIEGFEELEQTESSDEQSQRGDRRRGGRFKERNLEGVARPERERREGGEDRRPKRNRAEGESRGSRASGAGGRFAKGKKKSSWQEIQFRGKPKPQKQAERPALPKPVPQDDRVSVSQFSAPVETQVAERKVQGERRQEGKPGAYLSREEHIKRRQRRRKKGPGKTVSAQ
ncbi:MAG: DEAD/DEAH box helicase [Planctomycetales bacterium]